VFFVGSNQSKARVVLKTTPADSTYLNAEFQKFVGLLTGLNKREQTVRPVERISKCTPRNPFILG
jgi:hypothetical protein